MKKIRMKPQSLKTFQYNDRRFRELLMLLITWTCGQAGRGTEMLSIRYKNVPTAQRNIYLMDGQIVIITTWHKSQNITEHANVGATSV
jgi:hypothetical protein